MFQPLHHSPRGAPTVEALSEIQNSSCEVSETEGDAQMRATQKLGEDAAHLVYLGEGQGGVDAAGVLHDVHPLEVHARVEAPLDTGCACGPDISDVDGKGARR